MIALLVLYSIVGPQAVQAMVWPATEKDRAGQAEQTVLVVVVHAPPGSAAEPAAHVEQAEHGDWPLALQVAPATQFATGMHESEGTSQKKPGAQLQSDWPSSVPVTYAEDEPHRVQEASPELLEKLLAGQSEHTVSFVAEQADDGAEPAAQTAQAEHGAKPEELKLEPTTQGMRTHTLLDTFQA